MNRDQLIRVLRKEARQQGFSLEVLTFRGKGSHLLVRLDGRQTTLADREYGPRLIALIRRNLGLG